MYKFVRIENPKVTEISFSKSHDINEVYDFMENKFDSREYIKIKFICKNTVKTKFIEYLKAKTERNLGDGSFVMTAYVLKSGHFWYGTLLSLEDNIKVLEPLGLIDKLCKSSENILKLYE